MRILAALLGVFLAAASWSAQSVADGYGEAEALFEAGDFRAAAMRAAALETADGLALAARATLVQLDYLTAGPARLKEIDKAEAYARRAMALDPNQVEGRLYLAIALGNRARALGAIVAHLLGFAEEGRKLLDEAAALDPDNAWCQALLGAWHLEIIRYGGDALGDYFYGADLGQGLAHFERAFLLSPDNLPLNGEFAVALLSLDSERFGPLAEEHLRTALQLTPHTALDRLAQARAQTVFTLLQSGDRAALTRLLDAIRGRSNKPVEPGQEKAYQN